MGDYQALSANSQNIKRFQLHQKARAFLFILVIGLPIFLAMLAYLYYQDATQQNNKESVSQPEQAITTPSTESINTLPGDPLGSEHPTVNNTTPPPASSSSPVSQTPSGGIPDGVTAALNSIEANGIKGNQYITFDTSDVPAGTIIKTNRSSWSAQSSSQGTVSSVITVLGQNHTGSLSLGLINGEWRVTSYSMDN